MKSPQASIALATVLLALAASARADKPFFEETFNQGGQNVQLFNDAFIASAGSGVSGKAEDLAYEAAAVPENVPGPSAKILAELPDSPLEGFTIVVWYKAGDTPFRSASIINTHGMVFSWDKNQWFLRVNDFGGQAGGDKYYGSGTSVDVSPGQWKFVACTWSRANNEAIFYFGDKAIPAEQISTARRNDTAPALTFGESRFPKTIGNTFVREANSTFPGNIDNIRLFDKVLTQDQIEQIRKGDLENKEPSWD